MTMIILSSGNTLNMSTYMTYTVQPYVQRKSITTENPLLLSSIAPIMQTCLYYPPTTR